MAKLHLTVHKYSSNAIEDSPDICISTCMIKDDWRLTGHQYEKVDNMTDRSFKNFICYI